MFSRFRNGFSIYHDVKVAAFERENESAEKGGVVFLGDSITDFCDLERWYPGLNAYNRGIAGDMTLGVMRRMDSSVFDLEPRLVVMLIGINDLARHQSVGDTAANIASIISEIRSALPETYIIVQSVYPVNSDWGTAYAERVSPLVTELNALISAGAEAGGYVYADIYPVLDDGTGRLIREYSSDGLHPNEAGYSVISRALMPYIEAAEAG